MENLQQTDNIPYDQTIPLVKLLLTKSESLENKVASQYEDNITMKKEIFDLKSRVADQERYSSKDRSILTNFHVNIHSTSLTKDVCRAFKELFNYNIGPESIKGCHPSGNPYSGKKFQLL